MSEVAKLRAKIEQECESIRLAMYGFAVVASHDVIERRYNALGEHQEALEKLVGKDEAGSIVARTYAKVVG
jgi:hypothetical protein